MSQEIITYLLKTDGEITKVVYGANDGGLAKSQIPDNLNMITPEFLNPKYFQDQETGVYMYYISKYDEYRPPTEKDQSDEDHFLIMHEDNDLNLASSELPINQALRKYFPNSPFVGDILAVRTSDSDEFTPGPWSLDDLFADKKMIIRALSRSGKDLNVMIVHKDFEFPRWTEDFGENLSPI